jgi:hypothetical protein
MSTSWRVVYFLLAIGAPVAVFIRLTWVSVRGYAKEQPAHRWRRAGTWLSVALPIVFFIGAVTLQVNLYQREGNYGQPAFEPQWQTAMNKSLIQSGPPQWGCHAPPSTVSFLAGFGTVDQICIEPARDGHGEQFRFLHGNPASTGLLYAPKPADAKTQYDFCVKPISGPWWILAGLNPSTSGCPSGYTFDPAP